jgi:hypothetical protein
MAVIVVVVAVPVVPDVVVESTGVGTRASRLKAVPWRKPETTALACSSLPRNSANSALNLASVVAEVPMAVVVVDELVVAVVVDVVLVSSAWAAG